MDAVTERQMAGGVPAEVEAVGVGEAGRVTVGGGQGQQDGLSGRDGDPAA